MILLLPEFVFVYDRERRRYGFEWQFTSVEASIMDNPDDPHPGLKAMPADKSDIYTLMRSMDLDRRTWMEEIERLADRLDKISIGVAEDVVRLERRVEKLEDERS